MRFRSLESRIVTLFLVLMLAVQLAGFLTLRSGIQDNALASIKEELTVGERVFKRLLQQNAQTLTQGARLLAADYGFRQAIGSDDGETIASALANHGARIGSSLTLFVGSDRHIKASTATIAAADLEQAVLLLVDPSEQGGGASGIGMIGAQPYQIVVVPVKAPLTVGWVAMTFPIGQQLANEMLALSSLQVTIVTAGKDGLWQAGASTLPPADNTMLAQQLARRTGDTGFIQQINLPDSAYSARVLTLLEEGGHRTVVVLQRSISEALAPYQKLQLTLLVLTGLGILVAAVASIFTAKRIAEPLKQLADTAKRLGAGDFKGSIALRRDDEIGALSQAFEIMRDDIGNRELEIRRLAYWDTLTGLPNRAQFVMLLNEALAEADRNGAECFILMMDLDRFKNVNDVLGHGFGDSLLREVAKRLTSQIAPGQDQVARLGGDEFAILLPNKSLEQARNMAARVLTSLELPFMLEDQAVDLGAGIGVAGYPLHGADAASLLSRAELAMYAAKSSGNEAVVYAPAFDKSSQQNLSMMSELRRAVEQNELRLYVQPKIKLGSGELIGLEALVRWQHPDKGLVFPDSFIPFAEKTGFIRTLTHWMIEQSAMLCRDLAQRGLYPKISVNLSARDLLDPNLPVRFGQVLARHGVKAASFCLEITESAIMDDPMRALATLEGLHAMGVELSIDDFGTGYSSLAYLKQLPVDELKIDKSFVMNMERDANDSKIVRSTIDLGHNMGLRVVAEGIESQAVWSLLARMGCDHGQGYFISRPIPADRINKWIGEWAPPATSFHGERRQRPARRATD